MNMDTSSMPVPMALGHTYLPILKWKRGEQTAVAHLAPAVKSALLPVFEALPDSGAATKTTAGSFNASLNKLIAQIGSSWGAATAALELAGVAAPRVSVRGNHPVDVAFARARADGLALIPVTGLGRGGAHDQAVARVVARDQRGLVLRVSGDDLVDVSLATRLGVLANSLGTTCSAVDLVLDWGFADASTAPRVAAAAAAAAVQLSALPWRTITFAAGSFPQSLSHIGASTAHLLRGDWAAWNQLRAMPHLAHVRFGDYAVAHPVYTHVPYVGAANIRYTVDAHWLVLRGHKLTGPAYGGFGQFVTLARQLAADPRYCGPAFSWGDDRIARFAAGAAGTGNSTTWRAIATNHHLTFVARQIATSSGASAGHGRSRGARAA
jgi:hypothetical protein